MPHLFLISGLGADRRAFDRLSLSDWPVTHIDWAVPDRKDTMHTYARKLAGPVMAATDPIVIGVSLGGMVAGEMTAFIPHMRAILISTIKAPEERPMLLRVGAAFPIHGLAPTELLRKSFLIGADKVRHGQGDIAHMKRMLADTDGRFLRWGLLNAPRWKGRADTARAHHIHGDADRLFPIQRIRGCEVLPGGTHFMVYQRGEEMTERIGRQVNLWAGS